MADDNLYSDEDLIDIPDEELNAISSVCVTAASITEFFNPDEFANEDQRYVDRSEGVRDQLTTLRRTPSLFKVLTNFTLEEFEELCCKVCHTIVTNARSTGLHKRVSGRPPKLSPDQRVLHFILYLKHDNIVQLQAYGWNYASSSSCDDCIFVASCINNALEEELSWPDAARRRILGQRLQDFKGCIGHIDGTLVQIRRPSGQLNKSDHRK